MTLLRDKTQRRIVPRWRPSGSAPSAPEFASVKTSRRPSLASTDHGGAAFRAFAEDQCVGSASEALAEALLERNAEVAKSTATYILQHASDAPPLLLALARESTGPLRDSAPAAYDVATTRALLRLSPRNAALWSDLARHHAGLGDKRQAHKYMKAALQLAPNHRWMLRTASRFFVHQEDAEAAHRLLAEHPRTRNDPWLIAAELACAHVAGRQPKFWKVANEIIRFDRFSPSHISELATAVGMMELESGNRKQARKLVNRGLIAPTENTLAQVLWAKETKHLSDGIARLDSLVHERHDAFEAEFKLCLKRGDMPAALTACKRWIDDEPFAARPKQEVTYVAALLDDHDSTCRMAQQVLRVDGRMSVGLELNEIFAKLSGGKYGIGAQPELQRVRAKLEVLAKVTGPVAVHATANLALWNYRHASAEVGKALYRVAIELARKTEGFDSAAHAAIFAAREALRAGDPTADVEIATAVELATRAGNEACLFYTRKLQAAARTPARLDQILSPSSAVEFLKPTRILKVAKEGEAYVLTIG